MSRNINIAGIIALILLGGIFFSCNKDDVIEGESSGKPVITLDNESGVYPVKTGKELTISPTYQNVTNASYRWEIDGRTVADTPELKYTWTETGVYYIDLTVSTKSGSAREEMRVDVLDMAAPVISLPIAGDELMLALGTQYMFSPEISNSDVDGFKVEWKLDGKQVEAGSEGYLFTASRTGDYSLEITASNSDGEDSRTVRIKVVEKLPYSLSFPTPSYLQTSTTRYTFAGRPVYLTPLMENLQGSKFVWSVNGSVTSCTSKTFPFTPDAPGDYIVNLTVDDEATAWVKVVCVDASEADRYRKATAASCPSSTRVFEWIPAPGQFINETLTGGMSGNESTPELANAFAQSRLEKKNFVSLGGFGGYIIVGFDHSISKRDGLYDFAIMANAYLSSATNDGGSNEPGIVYVMQDVNGNGLPDDEWYELRGSETANGLTRQDYAVTYYRPAGPAMPVQWTDNYGASGTVDYLGNFHRQDYYYPAWITADSYTLRGTCLKAKTTQDSSTGLWDNSAFGWGYADNKGSDDLGDADDFSDAGQRNGFMIGNAMYPDLSSVNLQYIDFIKVQTGVNSKAGRLGEVSTEVFNFQDLSLMK